MEHARRPIVLVESNDPNIQLAFNQGQLKVTGAYDDPITIRPRESEP